MLARRGGIRNCRACPPRDSRAREAGPCDDTPEGKGTFPFSWPGACKSFPGPWSITIHDSSARKFHPSSSREARREPDACLEHFPQEDVTHARAGPGESSRGVSHDLPFDRSGGRRHLEEAAREGHGGPVV